jgi:pimeloyl-ACP methyl ester carboxylesterase
MKHMSTGNVAHDLDRLRAAVGDTKLTFAGFSYGSMIGATYANLFPGRVRAILIDGIHDPVLWTTGRTALQGSHVPMTTRLGSHRSASATLQRLFRLCRQAGPADCALARSGDPKDRFDQAARQLRREPLELELDGASVLLTFAQFISTTLNTLRDPFSWQEFSAFADDIATQAGFRAVSRSYQRLHASLGIDEGYGSDRQSIEGFPGALCVDSTNPGGWPAWSLAGRWADAQARYFGRPWTWNSIACATWPARDRDRYTGPWSARTAHPVLVVGNRFAPATPYVNARAMARLLPRARLLTLNGQGHVASGLSSCIDAAESAYLLRGALPPRGTVCDPDFEPFGPVPSLRSTEQRQQHDARRQLIGATGALT